MIILLAYSSVYPKLAGLDVNKVAWLDIGTSGLALMIVGYKYWNTGQVFTLLIMEVNWFWFTLISYTLIEIPIALWYFREQLFNKRD